jgi:twitching motility protein PilT
MPPAIDDSRPRPREFDLAEALIRVVHDGASDLHLKAGNVPLVRIAGKLGPLGDALPALVPHETEEILHRLLAEAKIKEFETRGELDFAYSAPGLGRFRVNAYRQRGSVALVLRLVSRGVPTISELGLPPVVEQLAEQERGLVLVTGTTGSGKSTTVAAMIDHINRTMCRHIVTVEDPIEYLHQDAFSSVDQREVGSDTESFRSALRQVMRQDPDVIFIGEIRDEDTVRTALSAAETGHLVFSTMHTVDAAESVNRILDFFPSHEQKQVRALVAGTLKGVVSQRLVPAATGAGRVAVVESLVMTGLASGMILDPDQTAKLTHVIAEGRDEGMQTFDHALYEAVAGGAVRMEDALRHATRPDDLMLLAEGQGLVLATTEDVPEALAERAPNA